MLLVLFLCIFLSEGMYVILKEGQNRCFRAEVPTDTLVVSTFTSSPILKPEQIGSSSSIAADSRSQEEITSHFRSKPWGIQVIVKAPSSDGNGQIIHSRTYESTGRSAFTSDVSGDHEICFSTNTTAWFNPITFKFEVEIHTGVEAQDYDDVAKKEHLSSIEVSVRRLYDRAREIRQEMSYQKEREEEFRGTSESTNSRAAWWSVFQILIVIAAAIWQMQHLKSFFKKRKLI